MESPTPKPPECYFCQKSVTEDNFCFGCKQHICEKCDRHIQFGHHEPEDHQ